MNSLIAEQASEIAILKTLGGRRRQISGIVVRSAAMLGTAAAIPGTIVGIALAYLLVRYFAIKLIDVPFGFAVSVPVVVASLLLGPVIAVLAALPALRRALRRPVAETLAGGGATAFGSGWLDRLVARGGGRRLPGSLRMGVRNVLRQKRRSVATIAQVAVAVGLAVAMLALGQSLAAVIGQTIGKLNFSVAVGMSASKDAKPFGSRALAIAKGVPGVASAQPVETSSVQYDGQTYTAWGMVARPLYAYRLSGGRWFTAGETAATARSAVTPVVLGPSFARSARARVGQVLTLDMAVGLVRARVVGIDTGANDGGAIVYFPLPVLERLDGGPGTADSMWVRTASSSHAAVNRVATALAAKLDAAGYAVTTSKIYVIDAQDTASVAAILTIVEILGLLVVAIMLIGLASGLSMGIMERTREVGILRCVGARSRDIRRVFSTEAIVLALAGWVVGILLGWLIFQGLAAAVRHSEQISLPETFSPVVPLVTLVGLIVLTLLVIRGPLRRATRVQPGLALRYQ
jgi:putative ABC transport system permease protein